MYVFLSIFEEGGKDRRKLFDMFYLCYLVSKMGELFLKFLDLVTNPVEAELAASNRTCGNEGTYDPVGLAIQYQVSLTRPS